MYMLWFMSCTVPHTKLKNFLHTLSEMNASDTNWILMNDKWESRNEIFDIHALTIQETSQLTHFHWPIKNVTVFMENQTSKTCESNNSLYRLNLKGYDSYMDVVQWQMLLLLYLLFFS